MWLYYFLIVPAIFAIPSLVQGRGSTRALSLLLTVMCAVVAGFRWMSDVDYSEYAGMYEINPQISEFNIYNIRTLYGEAGYLFLSAMFKSINAPFYIFTFTLAVFSVFSKAFIADKFSKNSFFALLIYFCVNFITIEFIQIRWAVATALIIISVYFQYNNKLYKSLIFIGLATAIHYFSVISVLVFIIAQLRKSSFRSPLIFFMFGLGFISILSSLEFANIIDLSFFVGSDTYVVKRALNYIIDPTSYVGPLSYGKLILYVFTFYLIQFLYPEIGENEAVSFLQVVAFSFIGITLIVSSVPLMHFRASVLADFFSAVLICMALDRVPRGPFKSILTIGLAAMFGLWYWIDVSNYISADRLYSYQTWL